MYAVLTFFDRAQKCQAVDCMTDCKGSVYC
jgi:hypothetical protein